MNPFKFTSDDTSLLHPNSAGTQWFPRRGDWKWPEDYRSCVSWIFVLTILTGLVNIARAILHPRSRTLLQNLLLGPAFYSTMIAMCGVTLWAIWTDKAWARRLAVATSTLYILQFLRQFVIPVRPNWEHYLASLIIGVAGVVAFSWSDKRMDAADSDQARS